MDQAKFAYPRGDVFRSKDLGSFQRPRAHITGVIAHGHLTLFSVSSQDLRKDSNTMVELVSHTLTLLSPNRLQLLNLKVAFKSKVFVFNRAICFFGGCSVSFLV